ncbi:hypothetical protein NE634_03290 [Lacrimispora saccharolytica]|nr:hypothetical protein [Lacrimispora saccharolytica]
MVNSVNYENGHKLQWSKHDLKRCNEGGMLPSEAEVRKHGEELNKVWQSLRRYLQRRA